MSIPQDSHSSFSLIEKCMSQDLEELDDWADLDQAFQTLYETCNSVLEAKELNEQLILLMGKQTLLQTVQGHAIRKPYGQGGDFVLIDQIYLEQTHENPRYGNWDRFCHSSAAAIAIRKRKAYFKHCLQQVTSCNPSASILHLAGGSGREIFEFFEENQTSTCSVDVASSDRDAITFATNLNRGHLDKIQFHKEHAFRFSPKHDYDLIWGGAICDYLDDEYVVHLLSKIRNWGKTEGQIVLTSFTSQNPSRAYMELMMDWYLYHRSPADWIQLAGWSGFHQDAISIYQDDIGVHLSLTLR